MSILSILVTILLLDGTIKKRSVHASEGEDRLVHYLFSEQGYNPLVRPTQHSNETVVVAFGLLLVQLIHVTIEMNSVWRYSFCSLISLGL